MMNKRKVGLFGLVLTVALGFIFLSTGLVQADLPTGVTSLWKLEENLTGQPGGSGPYVDEVDANPGDCSNGGCPTQVAGKVGFGQAYDSSAPKGIDIPPSADFDWAAAQSFSIELWMKPVPGVTAAGGNLEVMIGRRDNLATPDKQWFLGVQTTGEARFSLRSVPTTINVTGTTLVNAANAATGDWYHIVAVRDVDDPGAKQIRLYVNGALDGSAADTFSTNFTLNRDIKLGWLQNPSAPFFFFNGTLDEAAIYNRVLTADEILQHFNDGLAGQGVGFTPEAAFTGDPLSGASGTVVEFTDQSVGNITSWAWTFGDGGTSTEQDPPHTYSAVGTYDVGLTVTGPYGTDTETKAAYVVISDNPPVANFAADITTVAPGATVNFTDQSTPAGEITIWAWTFGDGGTSTEQNPSHTYADVGTYDVALTVTGPGGTDGETKAGYITVTTTPTPPPSGGGGGGGGCFIGTIAE